MDPMARPGWWPVLRVAVAVAAIAFGLSIVLAWVANIALSRMVTDEAGAAAVLGLLQVLGWVELGLSVVVLGGLAVGVWLHRPLWARGVASVTIGMLLHWGWWVLDRRFDLFGTYGLADDDPILLARMETRLWTMLAVDVASILALVLGGALLLRHREPPAGEVGADPEPAEPEPDAAPAPEGDATPAPD